MEYRVGATEFRGLEPECFPCYQQRVVRESCWAWNLAEPVSSPNFRHRVYFASIF